MSPQLKSVYAAGTHALLQKNDPTVVRPEHFFSTLERVKMQFARLIDTAESERVALIPSVSYGVATVANNLNLRAGQNVVIAAAQFPSNYYSWAEKCAASGAELRVVERPPDNSSTSWSEALYAAIDENTALLALSALHWADGSLWDLPRLRTRTRDVGAWLLIDGTQSVGALPFSVNEVEPDALIVAGYKWMLGPYSTGYAYYGPAMDNGKPIEENWINRAGSEDFKNLVNYRADYRPGAARYSVGQQSNFLLMPMLEAALQQLNAWGVTRIQRYCEGLWEGILPGLEELGIQLAENRAHHLVGLRLPEHLNAERLPEELTRRNLTVSFRGDAIRVAPNVYNRPGEMQLLLEALRAIA
ncbi:aminotransferase [Lewinellaceae bacterium SD302]|nr:aminotransferase [Lewinellaceae bacterium SD302]